MEEIQNNRGTSEEVLKRFKEKYSHICEAFSTVELEQLLLFAKKCMDYGMDNISGGTKLESPEDVEFALNGIYYRMQDKMNRWKTSVKSGYKSMNCENLLDTFQDLANYAMIAQLVTRKAWHE